MDKSTFSEIITEYGKDIYSYCLYLTRNKEDADDLYQQSFLIAIEKGDLDIERNPKSYLLAIATNVWSNQKRKFLWRKKKADIVYMGTEEMDYIPDERDNIYDQLIKDEQYGYVRRVVNELPDKMRVVILMYYMEEMKIEDIAKALEVPAGTIKSRLHQAKSRLRERLGDINEG